MQRTPETDPMSVPEILREVWDRGLRLQLRDGEGLRLLGPQPAVDELIGEVRAHEQELIAALQSNETDNQPIFSVADMLKVMEWSRATLYRRIANGSFPAPQPGTRRKERWSLAQLMEALAH